MTDTSSRAHKAIYAPGRYLVVTGNKTGRELYIFSSRGLAQKEQEAFRPRYAVRVRPRWDRWKSAPIALVQCFEETGE